jgi:glycosyltransferase involved in cell wall biosynthesis
MLNNCLVQHAQNNTLITFIIPTIGRSTLPQTLCSLVNQTNPNWKAIVMFDGISPTIQPTDPRIRILDTPKLGQDHNSAGLVRNYAITFADTEWVAFVDDDDSLSNKYVELFISESSAYTLAEIIIFRMMNRSSDCILPDLSTDTFYFCQVGISFAVKKKLFDEGHVFIPDGGEDFYYLDGAKDKGYKIMISPYVMYFVRMYDQPEYQQVGNRVLLF